MEAFTYLVVITGIIIGLGITRILGCGADLIVERDRVSFYWPYIVWLIMLFMILVQYWFNLFGWKNVSYNFATFISSLIFPLGTYLASAIISSPLQKSGKVELEAVYYSNSKWFFSITAIALFYLIVHDYFILEFPLLTIPNYIRIGAILLLLLLSLYKNDYLHKIGSGALMVAFVVFVMKNPRIL